MSRNFESMMRNATFVFGVKMCRSTYYYSKELEVSRIATVQIL